MFSPPLTKVPSTSLGCGLAVKQVAYASGSSCPLFGFSIIIIQMDGSLFRLRIFSVSLDKSSKKLYLFSRIDY